MNGKYDRAEWKIRPHQELKDPSLMAPVDNLCKWGFYFNELKTYVGGFSSSNEQK